MDPPVEVDMPDLRPQREEDMPRGAYIKKRHFGELGTQKTAKAVGGSGQESHPGDRTLLAAERGYMENWQRPRIGASGWKKQTFRQMGT